MQSLARRQIEALQIAEGYFGSHVLFAANELGVFDRLAGGPQSAADLARAVDAAPEPLERLVNAAVAVGLLTCREGRYQNTELTDQVLVPGRPGYLGDWMRLMSRWARAWTHLRDSVQTGKAAEDPWLHLGGDPDYTRDFLMGMHDYAQLRGSEIVRYLDFSGGLRLLDLGGGPGTYSILFAKQWPDLKVTLFDLPDVVALAKRNGESAGVADRVAFTPGNYYQDEAGRDFDVVFLSDTLHQESPEACEMILGRAFRALKPGGRIVVQAMFLNEDKMGPRWPLMHSLILLLVYGGGRAYSVGETIRFMNAAGFRNCVHKRMSLLNVNSLIVADRP